MVPPITSTQKFATLFNVTHPDVYRPITAEDIEDLKSCELIHRYGYYSPSQDGKTVMGILKYEQKRERRLMQETQDKTEPPKCKMCGQPLPLELEGKSGRPKEFCFECESLRNKERQKKLRARRRKHDKFNT